MKKITEKDKKRLLNLGYREIMIRNVPIGTCLNAENADSFPVSSTGSFIHNDKIRTIFIAPFDSLWHMAYITNDPTLDPTYGEHITAKTLSKLIDKIEKELASNLKQEMDSAFEEAFPKFDTSTSHIAKISNKKPLIPVSENIYTTQYTTVQVPLGALIIPKEMQIEWATRVLQNNKIQSIEPENRITITFDSNAHIKDVDKLVDEEMKWIDCPVPGCKNKICIALKSDKCFVHTKGLRWIKLLKIWYNNKYNR